MNKLAVIIPFYKRHELTKLCFENIKRQSEKFGFDVFTAGSEGEVSESLAKEYGFNYVEVANNPVSHKNNVLIQQTKESGYDGVILIGSDNFVADSLFDVYLKKNLKDAVMYGTKNLYFYRVSDGKAGKGGDYMKNSISIGVGRCFSKALLQELEYTPWNKSADRGLDFICSQNVGKREKLMRGQDVQILDVKHELNISKHSIVSSAKSVDVSELNVFGSIVEKILKLEKSNENETIENKKLNSSRIEIIKDSIYFKVGTQKNLPLAMAKLLVKNGHAKLV